MSGESKLPQNELIVALATPPGQGGIGIIRLSGSGMAAVCTALIGSVPPPREAKLTRFRGEDDRTIDQGLALYFEPPHSYTGEAVLELHCHGSPIVAQMLIRRCQALGARMARPGEFSERAFLSGQLDLAQAEAVADLIESSTESAARSAINALQGEFSERVHHLVVSLTNLRVYVEAAIDFPDEEIDFLADQQVINQLTELQQEFTSLRQSMRQGKLLRDGLRVVMTGAPNVGKSSLLNRLSHEQRAIVTDIPGTTRDTLEQQLELDGLPVTLIDTAGIRESNDIVEVEGIKRAKQAGQSADLILLITDVNDKSDTRDNIKKELSEIPIITVHNKIDLNGDRPRAFENHISLSAQTGEGIDVLIASIKQVAGFRDLDSNQFIARQRHIDALDRAQSHLNEGIEQLRQYHAGELLAEELRLAQNVLGEITGEVTSDELLGYIFSSFCIGK